MHPMHEQTNCCISADVVKSQHITLHLTVDVLTPPYHVCCPAFCALLSINNLPQWVYPKVSPKRPQAQGPCQLPSPWATPAVVRSVVKSGQARPCPGHHIYSTVKAQC